MKLIQTLDNGLKIKIESLFDWARLDLIISDAKKPNIKLAKKLSSKMAIEGDWEDYVMPDIEEGFSEQLQSIHREIQLARSENSDSGELHITSENASDWYGATNQARLALEELFTISKYNDLHEDDAAFHELTNNVQAAICRNHFYLMVQTHLLHHVM